LTSEARTFHRCAAGVGTDAGLLYRDRWWKHDEHGAARAKRLASAPSLLTLIECLCSGAGVSPEEIEGFCFALSGVSRAEDFRNIERLLRRRRIERKSKVIPDYEAALVGGTRKERGVVVISGTGSVVFGKNRSGKTKKVCGHGHLLGDPGSGYDIGIRALRAVIAAGEGRGEKTKLAARIVNEISLKGEEDIVPWLYSVDDPKLATARLAPTVISVAEEGDKVAGEILRSSAGELADVAMFAADSLGLTGEAFDVVLCGGVFENNPRYFHLMESVLSDRIPVANPVRAESEAAFGALVALLGRGSSTPTGKQEEYPGRKGSVASK